MPEYPHRNSELIHPMEQPFSLIWLHATDPRAFTPLTLRTGGTTRLHIYSDEIGLTVTVLRTVTHQEHGLISIQDHVFNINGGSKAKLNYEVTNEGTAITYNPSLKPPVEIKDMIETIKTFVNYRGAVIDSADGPQFISDGTAWIDTANNLPMHPIPQYKTAIAPPHNT